MNPTWLGSLCVWTSLRESRKTSQGVLGNVSRSLGNITLLLVLSQDVRSWPDSVPQTVSLCGPFPGSASRGASLAARMRRRPPSFTPPASIQLADRPRRPFWGWAAGLARPSMVNVQFPGDPQPGSDANPRGFAAVQPEGTPGTWLVCLGGTSSPLSKHNLVRLRKSVGRVTNPPKLTPAQPGGPARPSQGPARLMPRVTETSGSLSSKGDSRVILDYLKTPLGTDKRRN